LPAGYIFEHHSGMTFADHLEHSVRLRMDAWSGTEFARQRGQGFDEWLDEFEQKSEHFAIQRGGALVGYARVTFFETFSELPYAEFARDRASDPPGPVAYLSKVAVATTDRGWGVGRFLGQATIDYARAQGANIIYGEASDMYAETMRRLGYIELQARRLGLDCAETHFTGLYFELSGGCRA
jgi:GNAT superfamily N-acetyltransferase